ncbi:hypothetical protein BpHYR1_048669 [Brachionus plicatilis]|uniref:Uncharacterized protein n=1 Tax=Brachionus plicatilis TaxID=10195 RepID=A0A3M7PQX5_BRAPC|nr:hypothetical protein BpHYR1_048669 [Brachionus plicatilis]
MIPKKDPKSSNPKDFIPIRFTNTINPTIPKKRGWPRKSTGPVNRLMVTQSDSGEVIESEITTQAQYINDGPIQVSNRATTKHILGGSSISITKISNPTIPKKRGRPHKNPEDVEKVSSKRTKIIKLEI